MIIRISVLARDCARKGVSYLGEDSFHNRRLDRNQAECPYFFLSLFLVHINGGPRFAEFDPSADAPLSKYLFLYLFN